MSRLEIKRKIRELLPHDAVERVDQLTDGALARLTKRAIRHWTKLDEFCLRREESLRVREFIASQEFSEASLSAEIKLVISDCSGPS